jgi:hypothetical protein
VMDQRGSRPRRKRIKPATIEFLIRPKREVYADFSVRRFYEKRVTEKHGVKVSYNCFAAELTGKLLRSLHRAQKFLPLRARGS